MWPACHMPAALGTIFSSIFVSDQQIHIRYWHTPKNVSKTRCISARFGLDERPEVLLDHARIPAGKCKTGLKKKVRSLYDLSAIKVHSDNDSDAS